MVLVAPLLKAQLPHSSSRLINISRRLISNRQSNTQVQQSNRPKPQRATQARQDTFSRQLELIMIYLKVTSKMSSLALISGQDKHREINFPQSIQDRVRFLVDTKTHTPKTSSTQINIYMGINNSRGTTTSTDISSPLCVCHVSLNLYHHLSYRLS
jgi:hypothetical protein